MVKKATDFSFPSGHAGASFASAVAISQFIKKRYAIITIMLSLLISFSRIYIGIHYPTDVLFGMLSGIILGLVATYVVRRFYNAESKGKHFKHE